MALRYVLLDYLGCVQCVLRHDDEIYSEESKNRLQVLGEHVLIYSVIDEVHGELWSR
jgi:hypothetical protein